MRIKTLGTIDKEIIKQVYENIVDGFEGSELTEDFKLKIKEELDKLEELRIAQNTRTVATAGGLSRYKGTAIDLYESKKSFESNKKLVENIIKMGHKSIVDHNYITVALEDVTPIIEQIIIGHRFTSFTIKSRREVDFRNAGYYKPEFLDVNGNSIRNSKLDSKYDKQMEHLFTSYTNLVDNGITTEDARFILPYSYHSNIIMGLDAHEAERMICHCLYSKDSNITEVREFGKKLYNEVVKEFPYLKESITASKSKYENQSNLDEFLPDEFSIGDLKDPELLYCSEDIDDRILATALAYRRQCGFKGALAAVKDLSDKEKLHMMKLIYSNASKRELEQIAFTFQIPISLAVLTHLTRHRTQSLLVPDFVPIWDLNNYKIPPKIIDNALENWYKMTYDDHKIVYDEFVKSGVRPEDLVYFYLSGHKANVVTTMNGDTFNWISNMRMCEKCQWETKDLFRAMAELVKKEAPIYGAGIGAACEKYGKCPEGKECCGKVKTIKKGSLVI